AAAPLSLGGDAQRERSPDNQPTMTASSPSWGAPIDDNAAESVPLSSVWEAPGAAEDKMQGTPSSPSWDLAAEAKGFSPPAWLSMLTQDDRQQMSTAMPALAPSASPSLTDASSEESEGNEELPFGPAWLKSLGAATLDDEAAAS